jgi:hypothetical protein
MNIKPYLTKLKGICVDLPMVPRIVTSECERTNPKEIEVNKLLMLFVNTLYNITPGAIKAIRDMPTFNHICVGNQNCHGKNHTNTHPSEKANV